jgi:poly-gamma-glutamate capsule biosynthesis protein CapA/YwtB (metallophosphatase superfamily)
MLTRDVGRQIAASHDPALPFRHLAGYLAAADITFLNLESPFSDRGKRTMGGLVFNADPAYVAGLVLAGVDVVSTANNHARDCGSHGLEYTYDWLKQHGLHPVGTSRSTAETHRGVVLERNGIRFGFLAYTYDQANGNWRDSDDRIAITDIPIMQQDVARLARRCSVVIVSMHDGFEYQSQPSAHQKSFARAAVDSGAALVVGHHPHVVQRMEVYGNGIIFYSLGNFVFDQFQREETQRGALAEVEFGGNHLKDVRLLSVRITRDGPIFCEDGPIKKASGIIQRP